MNNKNKNVVQWRPPLLKCESQKEIMAPMGPPWLTVQFCKMEL